uniref:Uncharacterized protein n=1 Tax=Arundo donax TaxID=35708 RepID=A0A0A9EV42_ARUDO
MFLIYYYCVTFIHYSWSLRALLAVLVVPSSIIYCAVCPNENCSRCGWQIRGLHNKEQKRLELKILDQ